MDLKSAKVLVTGGSSGIGLETAKQLAQSGAQVVICARNEKALHEVAQEHNLIALKADVSQESEVIHLVESVIDKLKGFNVLINNAAFGYFSLLTDINQDKFNQMMATNLTGAMLVAREAAQHFIEQSTGNIINVASTAAHKGFAGGSPYCASKFALTALTQCWQAELRQHNIRVMQINPSEVQTNFALNAGGKSRTFNPTKLVASDIAQTIVSMLEMPERSFIPETTVWATNPKN